MATGVSPCDGDDRNCVWVAARSLTKSGHPTNPRELCIAITSDHQPCGIRATTEFGGYFDNEDEWVRGQPLCDKHADHIRLSVLREMGRTPNHAKSNRLHRSSYVYVARCGDRLKIGTSVQPDKRLRNIETQSGKEFDEVWLIEGNRNLERRLHGRFDDYRTLGEWFKAVPEILFYAQAAGTPHKPATNTT